MTVKNKMMLIFAASFAAQVSAKPVPEICIEVIQDGNEGTIFQTNRIVPCPRDNNFIKVAPMIYSILFDESEQCINTPDPIVCKPGPNCPIPFPTKKGEKNGQ